KVGFEMWEASTKQVKETFSSYGRIDIFRPYFDVEPRQVRNRLFQSLIPRRPSQMNVSNDMYGPSMIVLTMVALLLFSMKSSGYMVQDGTLMGTALLSCFSAWFFISLAISTLCYILSTDATTVHIFSIVSLYLCSRTRDKSHKLAMTIATFALHLGYLLYLHFGFHVMVEEIDEMLGDKTGVPSALHAVEPIAISAT
ncbi:Protein YIPF3, partial [Toxocara canis]